MYADGERSVHFSPPRKEGTLARLSYQDLKELHNAEKMQHDIANGIGPATGINIRMLLNERLSSSTVSPTRDRLQVLQSNAHRTHILPFQVQSRVALSPVGQPSSSYTPIMNILDPLQVSDYVERVMDPVVTRRPPLGTSPVDPATYPLPPMASPVANPRALLPPAVAAEVQRLQYERDQERMKAEKLQDRLIANQELMLHLRDEARQRRPAPAPEVETLLARLDHINQTSSEDIARAKAETIHLKEQLAKLQAEQEELRRLASSHHRSHATPPRGPVSPSHSRSLSPRHPRLTNPASPPPSHSHIFPPPPPSYPLKALKSQVEALIAPLRGRDPPPPLPLPSVPHSIATTHLLHSSSLQSYPTLPPTSPGLRTTRSPERAIEARWQIEREAAATPPPPPPPPPPPSPPQATTRMSPQRPGITIPTTPHKWRGGAAPPPGGPGRPS